MAQLQPIRFVNRDKSQFYSTLFSRVESYFKENNLSKYADGTMVAKTIILLLAYITPFVLLLSLQPAFPWSLLLWATMGVAMAGVGMGVMHDANHGSFSPNRNINNWLGNISLAMLGGVSDTWKMQHNELHHSFTNIIEYDDDIADKPGLRLSPHTQVRAVHRTQWIHALLIYGLTTFYWVTAKDFMQLARYTRSGANKNTPAQNRVLLAKIIVSKLAYFGVVMVLPVWLGIPFLEVLAGFMLMHYIGGIILTLIFQMAHSVEETTYPQPTDAGTIENDWAIHQMNTTVNFARRSRWLFWYSGGLNFQVEHHLFPKICHVHYPRIAEIVRNTAAEFNVPYLEHRSLGHALRSHFATLRRFSRLSDLDELMG